MSVQVLGSTCDQVLEGHLPLGGALWAFLLLLAPFNAGSFSINGEARRG